MTDISKVFNSFLHKISDYTLLSRNVTKAELVDELLEYYSVASAKFYKCKKSLEIIIEENNSEIIDEDEIDIIEDDIIDEEEVPNIYIEGDLNRYEIELIVKMMLVEYMTPIMLSTEVTRQSLSDKDFKIYSQANQLRELNLLYRLLQKESKKMITEYTYIGMTDEKW